MNHPNNDDNAITNIVVDTANALTEQLKGFNDRIDTLTSAQSKDRAFSHSTRTRTNIVIAVIVMLAIIGVALIHAITSAQSANDNADTAKQAAADSLHKQYQGCQIGNDFRYNDNDVWTLVKKLFLNPDDIAVPDSEKETLRIKIELLNEKLAQTFALRDCTKYANPNATTEELSPKAPSPQPTNLVEMVTPAP